MLVQKINQIQLKNKPNNTTNSTTSVSFGHRTGPVLRAISDEVSMHIYDGQIVDYVCKVGRDGFGDAKTIMINKQGENLVAKVYDGNFDIKKLPDSVESYYERCIKLAKGYFAEGTEVELK